MEKAIKTVGYTALLILAVILISAILVFLTQGFTLDRIDFANYVFVISFILSLTGGTKIVMSFVLLKKKLTKTPIDMEVEGEEPKADRLRWEYMMLTAGMLLVVISYYMVV